MNLEDEEESIISHGSKTKKVTNIEGDVKNFLLRTMLLMVSWLWVVYFCILKYRETRCYSSPPQIACTVTTVHITCMQTMLCIHKNLCTVLIPLCKNNLNLPIFHTDHYALRK